MLGERQLHLDREKVSPCFRREPDRENVRITKALTRGPVSQCEFGRRLCQNEMVGLQIRAQRLFRVGEAKLEGGPGLKWPPLPHTAFLSKPSEVGSCSSVLNRTKGSIRQLNEVKLKSS